MPAPTPTPNRKIQLLDISGVRAGGVAVINLPVGPRYKMIGLEFQDTARGDTAGPGVAFSSGKSQVVLGKQAVRDLSITNLDLINQSNGSRYGAVSVVGSGNGLGITRVPIFFEEPWRKRADYQNGIAMETGWLGRNDVAQIKVPIAAGVTPVLSAFAVVDDFNSGAANSIVKMSSDDTNTAANTVSLSNLFKGLPLNDLISQISFFDPSDSSAGSKTVTIADLTINGQNINELISRDQNDVIHSWGDMYLTSLAGIYNITFDHDDLYESLRRVGDVISSQLKLTLKAASAGTITRVTQALGLPTATA